MVPRNEYSLKPVFLNTINNMLLECKKDSLDFLDGPAVETCQCRGHGFDPLSRRIPHAAEQLSQCTMPPEACMPGASAPEHKKPPQEEAHALQLKSSPHSLQLEKTRTQCTLNN